MVDWPLKVLRQAAALRGKIWSRHGLSESSMISFWELHNEVAVLFLEVYIIVSDQTATRLKIRPYFAWSLTKS